MALEKKNTTVAARTQEQITQLEIMATLILEDRLAQIAAAVAERRKCIAEKLQAGARVEPGKYSLSLLSAEVRS